jgi:hypothetical protein
MSPMLMRIAGKGRRSGRWLGAIFATLSLAGGSWLVLGSSGSAAAQTFCGYGSSGGNVRTCVADNGRSVSSSATVVSQARVLQSCLHRNGARLSCTAYTYVRPGAGIGTSWVAPGGLPSGTYCAVTWRKNPNGSTTQIGSECFGVTVIG